MKTNNHNIAAMKATRKRDDFRQQWERRKQTWQNEKDSSLPNDASILKMAELARLASAVQEENTVHFSIRRRGRWIPYAAAASIAIGIGIIGLTRRSETPNTMQLPKAQKVNVNGQTVRFLCNNGCSAQEVLLSANDIIKK